MWYWAYHTKTSNRASDDAALLPLLMEFLDYGANPAFCNWSKRVEYTFISKRDYQLTEIQRRVRSSISNPSNVFLTLCVWGFDKAFAAMSNISSVNFTTRNMEGTPMLQVACQYGQVAMVNHLLLLNVDVSEEGGRYGNALQAASSGENHDRYTAVSDRLHDQSFTRLR